MPRKYKPTYRKKRSYVSKAVKRYVQKEIKTRPELKRKVTIHDFGTVNTTHEEYNAMQNIAQGDDNDERIGTRIQGVGLKARFRMELDGDKTSSIVRVFIYERDEDSTTVGMPSVFGQHTADNMSRMRLLYDRTFTLNAQLLNAGGDSIQKVVDVWIPHRKRISYASSTTDEPQKGNLHICVVSGDSTNAPAVSVQSAYLYRDL